MRNHKTSTELHLKNKHVHHKRLSSHSTVLENPNTHRLIELYVHAIPLFSHISLVFELILETVHRCFKNWQQKNISHHSHIIVVDIALERDWCARLYTLYMYWSNGNPTERSTAELGLRRALLGAITVKMDN